MNTVWRAEIHSEWDAAPLQGIGTYRPVPPTSMFLEVGGNQGTWRKPTQIWREHRKTITWAQSQIKDLWDGIVSHCSGQQKTVCILITGVMHICNREKISWMFFLPFVLQVKVKIIPTFPLSLCSLSFLLLLKACTFLLSISVISKQYNGLKPLPPPV